MKNRVKELKDNAKTLLKKKLNGKKARKHIEGTEYLALVLSVGVETGTITKEQAAALTRLSAELDIIEDYNLLPNEESNVDIRHNGAT